ncbi:4Fe-4S dicluster domain-containing protein [Candidatus Kryptonium thompsonii]|uniref:4Fe-4S dicluster domain-containing protein n=1 Tax=Candidatus Kryptonium thompsonii TaxID=1633631 RepID=UPI000707B379|nr:4Fe-4S dicluster domain-containing protein [Candidatus Kryptonium thompsoni]CUT03542.1 carbon-monoxide dehydrogenase iron sulfur subunit [Candidatus Kryptonium thompsoni]
MKKVFIDPSRCTGCKSCEIACAVEHSISKNIYKAIFEEPRPPRFNSVLKLDGFIASLRCNHCEDAPCVAVCPTSAIYRDSETNLVVYNNAKCIGCWQCAMACPFGAIYPDIERKVARKCDGCNDRVKSGMIPACVEACPTNALIYTDVSTLEHFKRISTISSLSKSTKTYMEVI